MSSQRALVGALLAALLVAGVAGLGGVAGAADARTANATITGTVTWANGTPAADATVRAVGRADAGAQSFAGEAFTTRTDATGGYELPVPAGDYMVMTFADGETADPRAVSVDAGERLSLDATLRDETAPPPDDANVTARVEKTAGRVAAGDTVRLSFSSAEEAAVGVRRLDVSFRSAVPSARITVADVEGGPVDPPRGTFRLLHLGANESDAISGMSFLLRVEQAAIGEGELAVYGYRGGSWRTVDTERVVATGDALLLRVDVAGTGYVAVASETTTTTATPWISTGTPPERSGLTNSGLRTGLGVLALAAAVALAVRGVGDG